MKNRATLKTLIGAVLALFLLTLAYWWLNREGDATGPAPGMPGRPGGEPAVAVEVAPVQWGEIVERRVFTGTLQPVSRFDVAARVGGRLLKLYVDLGDTVRRGQVVARLDGDEYRLEVAKAKAELEVAKAGLAEAESVLATSRREYERAQSLRRQGVASEAELDSALANYEVQQAKAQVAAAQVSQRRAALAAAELRLSYTEIRADWLGGEPERLIAERFVDEGSLLAANTPLFSLVGIDRLVAVGHAPERDYPRLRPGQEVAVRADAVGERVFAGQLARLAPVVREASRQARLEVEVANPEQILKPGMFVRLEIEVARRENALLVPRAALLERPGEYALYLVDEESLTARFVPVQLGLQSREQVEILVPEISGRVVTLGQHLLSDGAKITIPEAAAPGERSR
ncbi:efflux RND transporter periplasmic adaptor subunit [Desulfurivibrio alkaliphilus]|uniref:Efflux transporter, RND family, MFP subunit n=1 Tax=Desulfurivibrio alkaliphilus (strain DSM 19089 / UNIQEM U267 / AHT2) TaxID=589865 RepID=D6Z652_DESAT|nr:efflux RND transporter periplasmic adaptor subunit [Desulfurivibrio alkaliphilus]ADH86817.1 efflux transporter, RND family, MFP subunit [Desulfurivibrio alkaliphilus AHT 2]